ncbi:MATE family efflux transporter [Ancylobacter sp. SL191]|uniref:MATE family efflux transporter n=1 Tax=Ancylobacter sp. SL191 TaxID=2995166 RepID=UPI00226DB30F|nr:MATE family efflux transporter [Ancylobacter sp. SL191]WAC28491.1 MATE family efflux transporter [Ancylobacter sp. SL191]
MDPNSPPASPNVRPFTVGHGDVLRIAVPMMAAYLSTPLVGLVATMVVGQLGEEALIGGVALAAVIFDVIFVSFNFLRAATAGFTAQSLGAGDRVAEQRMLLSGLLIALAGGLLILAVHAPLGRLSLAVLGAEGEVAQAASVYFGWRIWSAPFALVNFVIFGWVIGLGRSISAMVLQTLLNGLNLALSLWWVLGLGWGLAGLALASLAAEAATTLAGLVLIAVRTDRRLWTLPSLPELKRLFSVNSDMMIRSFALLLGLSFFTRQSGTLGIDILAANTILLRFYFFGVAFLDGVATAAEQLAGRAVGARYRPAFDRVIALTTLWGFVFAVLVSLGFLALSGTVIALAAPGPEVARLAYLYLPYAVALPIIGVVAFQMDGVYIGATWSREMRNLMLASLVLYVAACAVLQPLLGNHGLWIALGLFQCARSVAFRWMLPRLATRTMGPASA